MRYLTLKEILRLHDAVTAETGGAFGLRDMGALESAVAQPQMTFEGEDLYPSIADKAASLAFTIIKNHPFLDGNKRTSHAAAEGFLILNGFEIDAPVDEQERVIMNLAAGEMEREGFLDWLKSHIVTLRQK